MQNSKSLQRKPVAPVDTVFGEAFQSEWFEDAQRSAAVIVPILTKVLPTVNSVIDVGCGSGVWLREFEQRGAQQVMGIEGAGIAPKLLQLGKEQIRKLDLRKPLPPLGRFELALSLEVANCLPHSDAARFVEALTKLSDVVVFSASVPGQYLRTQENERWQSYWVGLFDRSGFEHHDVLRSKLWYDYRVSWWYAQNMIIFVNKRRQDIIESIETGSAKSLHGLDVIHPRAFEYYRAQPGGKERDEALTFPFRMVEEGYRRCNILHVATNRYLALPQELGAYAPERLVAGAYDGQVIEEFLEATKTSLDQLVGPRGGAGWLRRVTTKMQKVRRHIGG